jgi:hypothetical protein
MEVIIGALVSFAVAMLTFLLQGVIKENNQLKKEKSEAQTKEYNAIKEGLQCMLRDRLIELHGKYTKRGSISAHGLQNWMLMYKAYKTLGGNGLIDHMEEEIEELPIE